MPTYYVRKTGDDANGGTDPDSDAVLTIAAAEALAGSGDTIDIGVGTWTEDLADAGVTYQGAGMFSTIINGVTDARVNMYDLKMVLNASVVNKNLGSSMTWEDVYIDGNGQNCRAWVALSSGTFNMTRVIMYNLNGGNSEKALSASDASVIFNFTNCIFHHVGKAGGFDPFLGTDGGSGTLNLKNCWLHDDSGREHQFDGQFDAVNRTYNGYRAASAISLGTGEFKANATDLFVDPENGNFSLKTDSPAIGAGEP